MKHFRSDAMLMVIAVMVVVTVASPPLHGREIVTEMTADRIAEAIKAGERGDIASGQLIQSSGWSWGSIHIATFSTPFMRVAAAARQAKREYRKFTPDQVTPEMVAPELHVYAWSQAATESGPEAANVSAIVITPRKGSKEDKDARAVHPLRFEDIPTQFQNLFGATFEGRGRMAVFPLSALSEDNEVRVVYDRRVTMGNNAAGGRHCDDCHVPFSLKNVR